MLSEEQIQFYRDNGYLHVSDAFTAQELDELEAEFDGVVARRSKTDAKMDATWEGDWQKDMPSMTIEHSHDVQQFSAAYGRVLYHPNIVGILSGIIGPNVQLHHTKLFQKPTETGGAFPLHQDYHYFPHEKHTMMAAVIHLSDATEDMGCIRVVPGSHNEGVLKTYESPTSKNHIHYLDPEEYPVESAKPVIAKRGDVVCFSYLTVHGSSLNTSDRVRKTVLIQARDPEDRPLDDSHTGSHAQGMMLSGVDPMLGYPNT